MDNDEVHLLIADDDYELRNLLSDFLKKYNFQVTAVKNGEELLAELAKNTHFKLVILDVMMPGIDGVETCRQIRQWSQIPIIMLTAVKEEADRILSLELGADDYLTKPFNPRELLARIKAVLRRSDPVKDNVSQSSNSSPVLKFSNWTLYTATRRLVSPDNVEVALSGGVYDLLLVFLERPQRVLSRDFLLEITKQRTSEPFDRSIDVQISRLRQKLEENPKQPQMIKTVRTGGYMFTSEVTKL